MLTSGHQSVTLPAYVRYVAACIESLWAKKCAVVLFGRTAVSPAVAAALSLTDFVVTRAASYNFLGVRLDEALTWLEQAKHVRQRAHFVASNIARLVQPSRAVGPGAAVVGRLCRAALWPSVFYGIACWRPDPSLLDELTSVLCRPLRRVLQLPRSVSRVDMLTEFGLLPPAICRAREIAMLHERYMALAQRHVAGAVPLVAELHAADSRSLCLPRATYATSLALEWTAARVAFGSSTTEVAYTLVNQQRVADVRPSLAVDLLADAAPVRVGRLPASSSCGVLAPRPRRSAVYRAPRSAARRALAELN